MTKTNYEHLNNKILYHKTTYLRVAAAPKIEEYLCKLEATKTTVISCRSIGGENFISITFSNDLIEKFTSNDTLSSFSIRGKTAIPDYLCIRIVDLRKNKD